MIIMRCSCGGKVVANFLIDVNIPISDLDGEISANDLPSLLEEDDCDIMSIERIGDPYCIECGKTPQEG